MKNTKLETILWTLCKILCYQMQISTTVSLNELKETAKLIKGLETLMEKTEEALKGDSPNA